MLLRGAPARDAGGRDGQLKSERRFGLDGAVVPGLLLLMARDLSLYDPPRVLAWRLSHDAGLQAAAAWLGLPATNSAIAWVVEKRSPRQCPSRSLRPPYRSCRRRSPP